MLKKLRCLNFCVAFLATLLTFPCDSVYASHGVGGEITWTCRPSGSYIFKLRFYRDCNGITAPQSIFLNTTIPGMSTILLPLASQNDISPDGLLANGTSACKTCANGNTSNPIMGLVEEFVYESLPVTLPSAIPAAGFTFTWGECCRSNLLTNIPNPGNYGFTYKATIYPYPGTSASPCFDSSPYFAEPPSVIICTGYPASFNASALDADGDSLVYDWGVPLDDVGNTINFAPGYLISQLPSTVQNPQNVPPVLNHNSGQVNFTSFTGGYFVTIIKVSAYKCGIKIAEINREINIVLNNNCPLILNGQSNHPPEIIPPFNNSYSCTVNVGDTVSCVLIFQDLDQFTNSSSQMISVNAYGSQFGAGFSDPGSGCLFPPCATLNPVLPHVAPIYAAINFNWVTACGHLGTDSACSSNRKTHYFVFKANDNYCPANGITTVTVAITVVGTKPGITLLGSMPVCDPGDTVLLVASGAGPHTWNTGFVGDTLIVNQSGTYSVSGVYPNSNCETDTASFIVTGTPVSVSTNIVSDTMCITHAPISLAGFPSGGTWTGPGVYLNAFYPGTAGQGTHMIVYSYTNSSGCSDADTVMLTVDLCTGINEITSQSAITLFPNPTNDLVNLVITNCNNLDLDIGLFNVYGQYVMDIFNGKPETYILELPVDLTGLADGIYVVKINGAYTAKAIVLKN